MSLLRRQASAYLALTSTRGTAAGAETMNVYTGLLFLQGHIADTGLFAEHDGYRQSSYGNPAANERALRERWENERREHHPAGREDDVAAGSRAAGSRAA
jgi:hypothetical protein